MKPKIHFTHQYFLDATHPITIVLIGVGGTGSLMLTRLARLNFALMEMNHPGLHITAYDDDIVEYYNIGRQNFNPKDVGEYKAFSLISKINRNFGTAWNAVNQRFDLSHPRAHKANIYITCVDTAAFRMDFDTWFSKSTYDQRAEYKQPYYWLDLGNNRKQGQLLLGSLPIEQAKSNSYETVSKLKTVSERFGDLQKHDTPELQGESCSYGAKLQEQSLFINDLLTVLAADILLELLTEYKIHKQGAFVDINTFRSNPIHLT